MQLVATTPVYDAAAVIGLFGIRWTASDLASFGPVPARRAKFLTFFDPGKSLLQLHDTFHADAGLFYPQSWYTHEPFAAAEEAPRYRRVRIEPVRGSPGERWEEQLRLLARDEDVPTARTLVTALVIHFHLSGERLFSDVAVRCRDYSSHGRVSVRFDPQGILLMDYWRDKGAYSAVGLASARM